MQRKKQLRDPLIDKFFKSLELRDFDTAATVLNRISQSADKEYKIWSIYLSGVIEQEKNRDWAKAEKIFLKVLSQNPPMKIEALVYVSLSITYQILEHWQQCMDFAYKGVLICDELEQPLRKAARLRQIALACHGGYLAGDFSIDKLNEGRTKCYAALKILECPSIDSNDAGIYTFDRALYRAITYEILGLIEKCVGNYDLAYQHFEQYLNIVSEQKNRFHMAFATWHLSKILHLNNSNKQQNLLSMYDIALNTFQEMNETYYAFRVLADKGTACRKFNQLTDAIECYNQSLLMLETVRSGISSESARRDFLSTVVKIHDNAILAHVRGQNFVTAFEKTEQARSRTFAEALAMASLNNPITRLLSGHELQNTLFSTSILLEFHCTGLLKRNGGQTSEQQAAIDVLFPGTKSLLFVVNSEQIIAVDLNLNPNALIPSDPHKPVEEYFLDPTIRRALYDKLIAPVADLIKDKRRVYIIPHGPLHYVPFHALIAPDGETLLRADGPEIVYAPSATILFREMKRAEEPVTGTCLTVGYNGSGESELLFAEGEAQYISTMADGDSLVGPTSKKEALYSQAANYQLVHFSCHGHFDPESPLESALHIAPDEALTGREIIDNLKLNCDLVTLSACESGLSKVQRGDELYGLIRAFMYAGARAIIASLWRADERTTLIFAERFYQLLQDGASYATALKDAQIFLKNLTRREAVEILGRYLVNEQGDLVVGRSKSNAWLTPEIEQQAERYLTELRTKGPSSGYEIVPGTADDDKIFADPWFWAPFVLIGDPQARSGGK